LRSAVEVHGSPWHGGKNNDRIFGGANDDDLYDEGGRDRINGDDERDIISGGDQSDRLVGGNGHDYISGGAGGAPSANGNRIAARNDHWNRLFVRATDPGFGL
jgi:Ca2+-binding RTX toxin-like protein